MNLIKKDSIDILFKDFKTKYSDNKYVALKLSNYGNEIISGRIFNSSYVYDRITIKINNIDIKEKSSFYVVLVDEIIIHILKTKNKNFIRLNRK